MSWRSISQSTMTPQPPSSCIPAFSAALQEGQRVWLKVWSWIPPCRKNCTCWRSLVLAECLWRPDSGVGAVRWREGGGAFQQWNMACVSCCCCHLAMVSFCTTKWRVSQSAHPCKSANGGNFWNTSFCSWAFALSNIIIMLFVSVVVSMEINRRHYFWRIVHGM